MAFMNSDKLIVNDFTLSIVKNLFWYVSFFSFYFILPTCLCLRSKLGGRSTFGESRLLGSNICGVNVLLKCIN